jgi:predicted protein tyrosine phosphatase
MSVGVCRDVYRGAVLSLQVLDRASACSVVHEEPYAALSITDPNQQHPKLAPSGQCRGVLALHFSDVGERFARLNVRSTYLAAFDSEMAGQVAAFVAEQMDGGVRLFVVHCEAGMSRSAGVAAALSHRYNGEDAFFRGQYRPNPWVRQLLLDALPAS